MQFDFAYPYFQVQITKDGIVFDPNEVNALMAGVTAKNGAPSDLIVMTHGWNNNMDDAKALYAGLSRFIKQQVDANPKLNKRNYAILGILWPSKKFEDAELIPSGAAALNEATTTQALKARVRDLRSLYAASGWAGGSKPPAEFDEIEKLMDDIEDDPDAQRRVVQLLRPLLPKEAASSEDASNRFLNDSPNILLKNLQKSLNPPPISAGSNASSLDPFSTGTVSGLGGAANFRDVLGGIKAGFMHMLNYATYYLMKARAGDVGVKGVAPLLVKLRNSRPDLRIHMVGHSFGCRVTATAINALQNGDQFRPDTVLLLQGAFSHNGFAIGNEADGIDRGTFRDVIEKQKVRGPIVITHTRNDKAVGVAYPIASRINGVTAAALGDENDKFGGLGSNGTQTGTTTVERMVGTLLDVGGSYPFAAGSKSSIPWNLKADAFIKGHSDIQNAQVGYAFATAMAAPVLQAAGKADRS